MQELNAARGAEMAMPAMRAPPVSEEKPSIWKDVEEFRAGRESEVFLSVKEDRKRIEGALPLR